MGLTRLQSADRGFPAGLQMHPLLSSCPRASESHSRRAGQCRQIFERALHSLMTSTPPVQAGRGQASPEVSMSRR